MKKKNWINWFTVSYLIALVIYAVIYFRLGLPSKVNTVVVPLFLIYGILDRYLIKKQQKKGKRAIQLQS